MLTAVLHPGLVSAVAVTLEDLKRAELAGETTVAYEHDGRTVTIPLARFMAAAQEGELPSPVNYVLNVRTEDELKDVSELPYHSGVLVEDALLCPLSTFLRAESSAP